MFGALRGGGVSLRPLQLFANLHANGCSGVRALHQFKSTSASLSSAISSGRKSVTSPSRIARQASLASRFQYSTVNQQSAFTASRTRLLNANARFFSSNTSSAPPLPVLSPPSVGGWLLASSTLVFAIIVVGGVTRLTESGLSITEWNLVTGVIPPLTAAQWDEEFEKYKLSPEFKLLNHQMNVSEFKSIFYMEWAHRILGRTLGLAFVFPLVYFAFRKKLTPGLASKLSLFALLIGAQGALGWYMVKSGLEDSIMTTPGAVPRVSQYRLAAHLGLAFVLYAGMFGTGMAAIKDWKYAHGKGTEVLKSAYENPIVKRFTRQAAAVTFLVFLTALSGAFVAGLDAGLMYNDFPLMGGQLVPPKEDLFAESYAKREDKSDLWWRNVFENPTTVQFDHRILGTSTYLATAALFARTAKPAIKAALPPLTRMAVGAAFAVANLQVLLGMSTLWFMVPVPLAAAHQAGSVALLSGMVHVLIVLRRPGAVARMWRQAKMAMGKAGAGSGGSVNAVPPTRKI